MKSKKRKTDVQFKIKFTRSKLRIIKLSEDKYQVQAFGWFDLKKYIVVEETETFDHACYWLLTYLKEKHEKGIRL